MEYLIRMTNRQVIEALLEACDACSPHYLDEAECHLDDPKHKTNVIDDCEHCDVAKKNRIKGEKMKVTFYINTGYSAGKRKETFDLMEILDLTETEAKGLYEEEKTKLIEEAFDDWLANYDMGWAFSGDDNEKVDFYINTGLVHGKAQSTFYVQDLLSLDEPELRNMPDEKLNELLKEAFDDWMANYDIGWHLEGGDE